MNFKTASVLLWDNVVPSSCTYMVTDLKPMYQDASADEPSAGTTGPSKMEMRRKRRRLGALQYRIWTEDYAEAACLPIKANEMGAILWCYVQSCRGIPRVLMTHCYK